MVFVNSAECYIKVNYNIYPQTLEMKLYTDILCYVTGKIPREIIIIITIVINNALKQLFHLNKSYDYKTGQKYFPGTTGQRAVCHCSTKGRSCATNLQKMTTTTSEFYGPYQYLQANIITRRQRADMSYNKICVNNSC